MLFSQLKKEPIFLKKSSNNENQLEKLKKIRDSLNVQGKKIINRDMKLLEYGIAGEGTIEFELKNSHIPMYILHDIYLEDGGLSAQIDYIVVTKKLCFVIECKNLYGNIDINNTGSFVRTVEFGGKKNREGLYSPITQNKRHIDLMKKISIKEKNNKFRKALAENKFNEIHRPLVVLSNPKTILNAKFAKKEVKEQVIRADQLVNHIKQMNKLSKRKSLSDKEMKSIAQTYLDAHLDITKEYTKKYEAYTIKKSEIVKDSLQQPNVEVDYRRTLIMTNNKDSLIEKLKKYRLTKSREESIKAYYIFSDKQLMTLLRDMPKTKDELRKVPGFGEVKVEKYGIDIVNIIKEQ